MQMDDIVMKARIFHYLLPASWRTKKAGGIIQLESQGLGTRKASGTNPILRAREDEMGCPSSTMKWGESDEFFLPLLFFLFRIGCRPPTLGRAIYFTESMNLNANFIQKHFRRYTQK